MDDLSLTEDDRVFIKRVLNEAKKIFEILASKVALEKHTYEDLLVIRYSIIQIVETISIIATKIASRLGYVIEGYVEAMRFLVKQGIVDEELGEELVRLARLRNLLVHRYWEVDDYRVLREARSSGLKVIERVLNELQRLVEG